ncbi:testis-expressed protein 9 isoform X2 [Entelurus aequoreus]|uniref:testis-expressed protein 9 isoform X2 n=1 Tax=Entelurus aequoreus TaxID=161455 RepID=UPI002B1E1E83|nr:testis-expressed protein 9 isoform X2 [Entelurus aequoreus]
MLLPYYPNLSPPEGREQVSGQPRPQCRWLAEVKERLDYHKAHRCHPLSWFDPLWVMATSTPKMPASYLLAKEEKYRLLNAKLEAKTATLAMREDQLKKEREEFLSKTSVTPPLKDLEDEPAASKTKDRLTPVQRPREKAEAKKGVRPASQGRTAVFGDGSGAAADPVESFLAKTIQNMEDKMNRDNDVFNDGDNEGKVCAGSKVRPQPPREQGITGPTQPGLPATGPPESGPMCRLVGPAAGHRQTRPAEDKARDKQGTASPQVSERPHPTRAERRDALPRGAKRPPAAGWEDRPRPNRNTAPTRTPPTSQHYCEDVETVKPQYPQYHYIPSCNTRLIPSGSVQEVL